MKVERNGTDRTDWVLATDVYFVASGGKWVFGNPEIVIVGGSLRYIDTLSYSIRL